MHGEFSVRELPLSPRADACYHIEQILVNSHAAHTNSRMQRVLLDDKDQEIKEAKKELEDAVTDTNIANEQLDEYMVSCLLPPLRTSRERAPNPPLTSSPKPSRGRRTIEKSTKKSRS